MSDPTSGAGSWQAGGVDQTLWRVAALFRLLGWAWMVLLVVIVFAMGTYERGGWILAALVLATVWTGVTFVAMRPSRLRRSLPWVMADGAVALLVGAASSLAGSESLFHGGYPMSWILVAAFAGGVRFAVPASLILAVEQVIVHFVDDRTAVGAAGSVVFVVFGVITGWAFDEVRKRERMRQEAADALAEVRQESARQEERVELANRLHDSVLQTLHAIRASAEDPSEVRYLARRQDRDLRKTIAMYRSLHEDSFLVRMYAARDEVEDLYRVEIDGTVRYDAPMSRTLEAVVDAAREAMVNAAKHSGSSEINLFAELEGDVLQVWVRDRGSGFDPDSVSARGLEHSISRRVQGVGGQAKIVSALGEGTEVSIAVGMTR